MEFGTRRCAAHVIAKCIRQAGRQYVLVKCPSSLTDASGAGEVGNNARRLGIASMPVIDSNSHHCYDLPVWFG